MPLERAVKLVLDRGFGRAEELGPNAVRSVDALLAEIKSTSRQGYGISVEEYLSGMTAVAVAIPAARPGDTALGTLGIAGPTARMSKAQLRALLPLLRAGSAELSALAPILCAQTTA
jgi:DNA-binding IclR family transcriptional regulator